MNKIKFETFKVVVENMSKQYQMELDLSQYINPETLFDNLSIALDRLLDEFYTDIALDTILYPYIYENNRKFKTKNKKRKNRRTRTSKTSTKRRNEKNT